MVEGMCILHVLRLSCTLIIDSRIWRRDIMTKRLRHRRSRIRRRDIMTKRLRHRRGRIRRSHIIMNICCRWRRQRRMMGTPLTVYLMVLNCMTW
jgi:hypothetical protein